MFEKTVTIPMNNVYMNKKFDFGVQYPYVFSKLLSKPRILNSKHIQHLYKLILYSLALVSKMYTTLV